MPRWLIAVALTLATWAVQQPGVAHARSTLISEFGPAMCSEGSQAVLLDGVGFGRSLALLSAAPSPSALLSAGVDERAGMLADAGADEQEGPIAWCISPDDPRCAPRDQSEGSPLQGLRAHTSMQDVSASKFPALAFGRSVVTFRPVQLGAPRAGVGLRLERPPQRP